MRTNLRHRLRRLYYDAWSHATPAFKVGARHRLALSIPGRQRAAEKLADWTPNWKSQLIFGVLGSRPGAFLDIGANIGQTLIDFCATYAGRPYVAFEPNPRCVELLSDLVRANALPQCLIVPIGLSDANGILRLLSRPGPDTDSGASTDATLRPGRAWDVTLVPCFRFDDISESLGIETIALIKIDVEGAELSVLQGMRSAIADASPWIACEVLHRDAFVSADQHQKRLDGLEGFLREMGYAILRVRMSENDSDLEELSAVDSFPNEVFSDENQSECDYLFVPQGDVEAAVQLGQTA